MLVDGVDRLPEILAAHVDDIADDIELPASLLRQLAVVPSYYLRYFYAHDEVVRELRHHRVARLPGGRRSSTSCSRLYADPALDRKPELLEQRGGAYYSEAAVQLCASLLGTGGGTSVQVVNVRNDGTLPFLPDDAVMEVPGEVDRAGVRRSPSSRSPRCTPVWSPTSRPTSTSRWRRLCRAVTTGSSRRCWRTRSSVRWIARPVWPTGWSPTTATYLPWA